MNRPDLYQQSIDTLAQAYFADELKHNHCDHCAVGNLLKRIAVRMNIPLAAWSNKFITVGCWGRRKQLIAPPGMVIAKHTGSYYLPIGRSENLRKKESAARLLILHSGYSLQELAKIEYVFETAGTGKCEEDYMFNGLMAVVDALDSIHENNDTEVTTTQKKRFRTLIA